MPTFCRTRWTRLEVADDIALGSGVSLPAGCYQGTLRQVRTSGEWCEAQVEIMPSPQQWSGIVGGRGRIPGSGALDVSEAYHSGLLTTVAG